MILYLVTWGLFPVIEQMLAQENDALKKILKGAVIVFDDLSMQQVSISGPRLCRIQRY